MAVFTVSNHYDDPVSSLSGMLLDNVIGYYYFFFSQCQDWWWDLRKDLNGGTDPGTAGTWPSSALGEPTREPGPTPPARHNVITKANLSYLILFIP